MPKSYAFFEIILSRKLAVVLEVTTHSSTHDSLLSRVLSSNSTHLLTISLNHSQDLASRPLFHSPGVFFTHPECSSLTLPILWTLFRLPGFMSLPKAPQPTVIFLSPELIQFVISRGYSFSLLSDICSVLIESFILGWTVKKKKRKTFFCINNVFMISHTHWIVDRFYFYFCSAQESLLHRAE